MNTRFSATLPAPSANPGLLHEPVVVPHDQLRLDLVHGIHCHTDDNQQLTAYQQWFPLLRDSGYVKGITIWGWIYGKTWAPSPNSGLIRNGAFRPAMTWLMQQLGRPTQ